MGLRTWLQKQTGIKLKSFDAPDTAQTPVHQDNTAEDSTPLEENAPLQEVQEQHMLSIYEIEPYLKTEGSLTCQVGEYFITLDLSYTHERHYAAKQLLDIQYPQSDIDSFLFSRFIKQGDRVLDAGANIGFTALEAIRCGASHVLAVEAIPDIFKRLNAISCDQLKCINTAISKAEGTAEMYISQSHNQGSSLNPKWPLLFPTVFGKESPKVQVPLTTVDIIASEYGPYDVWKIDIEGAECDLLRGAVKTLQTSPPRIIIAEILEEFVEEFSELVHPTHPYQYRGFIKKGGYQLVLRDIHESEGSDYYGTSPMYVFSQSEDVTGS